MAGCKDYIIPQAYSRQLYRYLSPSCKRHTKSRTAWLEALPPSSHDRNRCLSFGVCASFASACCVACPLPCPLVENKASYIRGAIHHNQSFLTSSVSLSPSLFLPDLLISSARWDFMFVGPSMYRMFLVSQNTICLPPTKDLSSALRLEEPMSNMLATLSLCTTASSPRSSAINPSKNPLG